MSQDIEPIYAPTDAARAAGTTLPPPPDEVPQPPAARHRSRRSITAFVCAMASFAGYLLVGLSGSAYEPYPLWVALVVLASFGALVAAAVLGILGIVQVHRSKGRVYGQGFAVTGLVVSVAMVTIGVVASITSGPTSTVAGAEIVMQDDFEGQRLWTEDEDPTGLERFANGGYEVTIKRDNNERDARHFFNTYPSIRDLTFSADVTVVRESGTPYVGVTCWANGSDGYMFALSSDEGYAVLRVTKNVGVALLDEGDGPTFHQGDTLRLSIQCISGGTEPIVVVGRVDGEEIARAAGVSGFDGFIAVGIWSATEQAGGTVRWDNAVAESN